MDAASSSIAEQDLRAAYRWILGREADETGLRHHLEALHSGAVSRSDVRVAMLHSPEFSEGKIVPVVGSFTTEVMGDIECRCSADAQGEMLAGIARHWGNFGDDAPHWSVLTEGKFAPESIDLHVEEFYNSGIFSVRLVDAIFARSEIDKSQVKNVMDFGCGVGRLTLAFAQEYPAVTGVDISAGHLSIAKTRAHDTSIKNVDFCHIRGVEEVNSIGVFDLIISFIVLQHNPPPVALDIINRLLASLKPGGVAVFQMPTFIRGYSFNANEYLASEKHSMEVNAIPQHALFSAFRDAHCDVLEVREDKSIANMAAVSQTFAVRKALLLAEPRPL